MTIELSSEELAHVLLGLRFLQIDGCWLPGRAQEAADTIIDKEGINLMSNEDLDELCERLNCTEGETV